MVKNKILILERVLHGLISRYSRLVPEIETITQAMIKAGIISSREQIENDHIAFRTLGVDKLGIQSLERIFLHLGYTKKDPYFFAEKKLNAYWYAPPEDRFPRVFISELRVDDLSKKAQEIIHWYTNHVKSDPTVKLDLDDADAIDAFLHSPLWPLPSWSDYQTLANESEYASWVICNRYYLNHFTFGVHGLAAPFNDMRHFVDFLEKRRIPLNQAGGTIKTSPDGKLVQASTLASMVDGLFSLPDGTTEHRKIPGSYVEFAERKVLDEYTHLPPNKIERKHRREGFEAQNADKIFESTYRNDQVNKPKNND